MYNFNFIFANKNKTMAKKSTAQTALFDLAKDYQRKRYPSTPDFARPNISYKTNSANGLTQAIIDFIDFSGGWATRVSVEGRYIESLGRRIPSSVKKGTPDIIASYKGCFLGIEVKIGKDTMSEDQLNVRRQLINSGGYFFIATDFENFYEWMQTI